tara:strand:- start:1741 stop:1983 length:243 start_codon:yes stop_codon:yes gene_type:complete
MGKRTTQDEKAPKMVLTVEVEFVRQGALVRLEREEQVNMLAEIMTQAIDDAMIGPISKEIHGTAIAEYTYKVTYGDKQPV